MLTRKELYNMLGWRTKRHLVVIESDDWGSIRMPSSEVYEEFLRRGIRVDNDAYCKYDALATKEDLTNLFEVLQSVKDKNGHHPVITANCVVANPIFDKIRESNFTEYHYEPFTATLENSTTTYALTIQEGGSYNIWMSCKRLIKLASVADVRAFYERIDTVVIRSGYAGYNYPNWAWNWWTKLCIKHKKVAIILASIGQCGYKLIKKVIR